jgi:transcription initiation factor TFIIIB Brf1 subunit/transcription initiation factor TFIIB
MSKNNWNEWVQLIKLSKLDGEDNKNLSIKQQAYNNESQACQYCGNKSIQDDDSQGNQVCMECGAVNGRIIDNSIEWKNKTDAHAFSGNNIRCSAVDDLLPKLSLSTRIAPQYGTKQSYQEHRISKLNQWQSGDPLERALKIDFNYIDGLWYSNKNSFPKNVLHTTKMLFKEYYIASYEDSKEFGGKRECLRGQTRKGMIGICIQFAGKINKLNYTKEYIASVLGIEKSKIRKAKPIFLSTMSTRIKDIDEWNNIVSRISTVQDFIRSYQLVLGIPYYVSDYAIQLYKYLKPFRLLGSKQPQSVSVVCLYVVITQIKSHVTLEDIIQKCVISLATIKNLYKKIAPYIDEGLIHIFTKVVCDELGVDNAITVDKITKIARTISNIPEKKECSIKVIIATSVLFVLITKDIHNEIGIDDVCQVCNVHQEEIIQLFECIMYYKEALIKRFI